MCTFLAACGSLGMSSSASWVERMIVPLGFRISIGGVLGILLMMGRERVPNVAVLPLSAMILVVLVGGPAVVANVISSLEFSLLVQGRHCKRAGSPRLQLLLVLRLRRPVMIVLFPPIMLSAVASVLCPSAGLLHVSLVWLRFLPKPWVQQ